MRVRVPPIRPIRREKSAFFMILSTFFRVEILESRENKIPLRSFEPEQNDSLVGLRIAVVETKTKSGLGLSAYSKHVNGMKIDFFVRSMTVDARVWIQGTRLRSEPPRLLLWNEFMLYSLGNLSVP